ncbi:hypothetical protein ACM66B_002593 [Microbotryomycetes sp. NB124-2]
MAPVTDQVKQVLWDKLERVLEAGHHSYSGYAAQQCKLADVIVENVTQDEHGDLVSKRGSKATTVINIDVDESMCNIAGNAHGGFLAWLIDHTSSTAIFCLATADRWITSGVSSNINTYYISAAPAGTPLRVVSTVVQIGRTTATVDVRVENRDTNALVCMATHVKVDNRPAPAVKAKMKL